jgi:hypothetical protein
MACPLELSVSSDWTLPDPPTPPPAGKWLSPNRRRSRLSPPVRRRIQVERDDALARLSDLDRELLDLTNRRIELLDHLGAMREKLWPVEPKYKGRRPPPVDYPPLDPIATGAKQLWGPTLRRTCRAVLRRHGPLRLRDLHDALHRYGYVIDCPNPVKALGDAMGYEADAGRVTRVRRGVYAIAPGTRPGRGRARETPLPPSLPSLDMLVARANQQLVDTDICDDPTADLQITDERGSTRECGPEPSFEVGDDVVDRPEPDREPHEPGLDSGPALLGLGELGVVLSRIADRQASGSSGARLRMARVSAACPDDTASAPGTPAAVWAMPPSRSADPSGRNQPWPPETSWTRALPAEIHGIIARSSEPTFSMGCSWP